MQPPQLPFNQTMIATQDHDVRGAYLKSSMKRRQVDDFVHQGPSIEDLDSKVRDYQQKAIFEDPARAREALNGWNPNNLNKIYNDFTHFRVWNRDEPSSHRAKMLDEVVWKPNPEVSWLVSYGENNTATFRKIDTHPQQ